MAQALPFIALAVTVGGTAVSIHQGRESEARQRQAQRVSSRQAALENQRGIREALAAARQDREGLIAAGFGAGLGFESSPIQGGLGAQQTQVASNVGFARQNQAFTANINRQLRAAHSASSRANSFAAIAALPEAFGRGPEASINQIKKQRKAALITPIKPA